MPRLALFCGEPLLARHVDALKEFWPNCRVVNSYGPTEATVLCSAVEVETNSLDGVTQDSVSIGEPIPGMSFIFRPIEDSDELELGIRGNQVAVGFLVADGQPAPSTDMSDGQRVWWSGDAVHRSGGHLFFSRRIDRQSKVRGYRIELAELDRAVMTAGFPVSYALVFDGELVTFVEGLDIQQAAKLRDDLSKHLPAWLVPSSVIPVASVPRTFNGKVDTSALSSVYTASKKSRKTQI